MHEHYAIVKMTLKRAWAMSKGTLHKPTRASRVNLLVVVVALFALFIAPLARSATVFAQPTISEFPISSGSTPLGFVTGPDGAVWFTEYNASKIGRITSSGVLTEYALAPGANPRSITLGPDGALW